MIHVLMYLETRVASMRRGTSFCLWKRLDCVERRIESDGETLAGFKCASC